MASIADMIRTRGGSPTMPRRSNPSAPSGAREIKNGKTVIGHIWEDDSGQTFYQAVGDSSVKKADDDGEARRLLIHNWMMQKK